MMRTRRAALAVTIAAGAGLLGACGDESDPGTAPEVTSSSTPIPSATGTVVPPETPTSTGAPQSVIDESVALLAEQLGVGAGEISVAAADEVTWRDGSLGCPQKGMGYTDALVPGVRVQLEVDGETYAFHQGGMQPPFYCASPDPDGTTTT